MPITITGPLKDSNGDLITGEVKFRPLPFAGGKGTAKTSGTTTLVSGAVITQQFTDGEPDFSGDESHVTLDLYAGDYEVRHSGTKPYTITVPSGDATRSIAELVSDGAEGLPSVELGLPSTDDADNGDVVTFNGSVAVWAPSGALSTVWGGIGGELTDQTDLQVVLDGKMLLAIQVTALPASPVRGQPYELTQADDTALAAPGFYIDDGTGWFCLAYSATYDLGNLTGALSLSLIAGAAYIGTTTGNITTYAVSLSRTGLVTIRRSNASGYTVVQPTSAGRTQKLLSATAWDDAAGNGVLDVIEDDGTYIITATSLLA